MKTQLLRNAGNDWKTHFTTPGFDPQQAQLVLVFGEPALITDPKYFYAIRQEYPNAEIVCTSAAGEIVDVEVLDGSIVVTAIQFTNTIIRCIECQAGPAGNSFETGQQIMNDLHTDDINAVLIFCDGTDINGSELVAGINTVNAANGKCIPVTGGLAGGNAVIRDTYVGLNELPQQRKGVAIGFYGSHLQVGHGCYGGWDEFGPERVVTSSDKNILYELDHKNALDLYKEYLGPYKNELPGTALLFPFSIQQHNCEEKIVRTIRRLNEQDRSLVFAGNIPVGSRVRLMKASFDKLVKGSSTAAERAFQSLQQMQPELILVVSCMGRKLVLQERTDEEVEAVKKVFGDTLPLTGFYSLGEISPVNPNKQCEFHNQTMTITTFLER